jgi:hypothetical protein
LRIPQPKGANANEAQGWFAMTAAVPTGHGSVAFRSLDAERLIKRWSEGRSSSTLRAYSNDLKHFAGWLGIFLGGPPLRAAEAVTALLGQPQGEANEIVRAYRSAMVEQGYLPALLSTAGSLRCGLWSPSAKN